MNEKPDWILSAMTGNLDGTVADIHAKGFKAQDFDIDESPETYWNIPEIKGQFKEDRAQFDTFYNQNKAKYLASRQGEFDVQNFNLPPVTKQAERLDIRTGSSRVLKTAPDPWGRTYGYDMSSGGYSQKRRGWREFAIETGVQLPNGTTVNAKDFKGLAKFAVDEDGGFKLNAEGKPYLVQHDIFDELRSTEEIYNPLAQSWGAYGHDYDGWQLMTSIPKNAINFFVDTLDSIAEFPKAIAAFQDDKETYKNATGWQSLTRSLYIPKTERGSESFFTMENMADLSQQVVWQLGAMVVGGGSVTSTAKLMGASAATAAKAGSVGGKLLMTGMAAGPIAKVARENNLTAKEAGILLAVTSAAFYPLMSLSEKVVKGIGISQSNAAIADVIEQAGVSLAKQGFTKGGVKAAIVNLRSAFKDTLYNLEKTKIGNLAGGAVNEAGEEAAEQMIDLGVRNLYNFYNENIDENSPIAEWAGTKKDSKFKFDWVQEAKNIGYSAIGGAMGGAIAGKLFASLGYRHAPEAKDIFDMVMDGKENVLYSFVKNMHEQGRLAPTWLDENNQFIKDEKISQNEAAANIIGGMVDYLVDIRDQMGITDLKANNEAKAKMFTNVLRESSVGADAAKISRNLVELTEKSEKLKQNTATTPEEIKMIDEEVKLKQQQLSRIVRGEFVNDYIAEGLYNLQSVEDPENPRQYLDGKSFVNLSKTIPTQFQQASADFQAEIAGFKERDTNATLDNAAGVTDLGKQRLTDEAAVKYQQALEALNPYKEQMQQILTENEVEYNFDNEQEQREGFVGALQGGKEAFPEESREGIDNLTARYQELKQAQELPVTKLPEEPSLLTMFTSMVERVKTTTGEVYNNSILPIRKKLEDEFATRKDMNKNGVSLYNGEESLKPIIASIQARIAQVKAISKIADVVNAKRMSDSDILLPELDPKSEAKVLKELKGMLQEATALMAESINNRDSADIQLRKATINMLSAYADTVGNIGDVTAGTPYAGLADLARQWFPRMSKALEDGEIDTFLQLQKDFENQAFEQFGKDRTGILQLFTDKVDAAGWRSGNFAQYIETYNYLRGILSLSSGDFWNSYRSTINNSNTANAQASDEQKMTIKRAVQSLMAGAYEPEFYSFVSFTSPKGYKFPLTHSYSIFVEGEGGTGKSSQVIPLIAGIIQKIDGGEVFLTSYRDERGKKVADLKDKVRSYFATSTNTTGLRLSASNLDIKSFLNDTSAVDKVNLVVYDEATLLTSDELYEIQQKVREINAGRAQTGGPLLKVLYTGDSNQNPIDADRTDPDKNPDGVYNQQKHIMDRTRPLSFSFRQESQQLKILSSTLKASQFIKGIGVPTLFEYNDKNEGVRIIHDQSKFYQSVASTIEGLKASGSLDRAVYITDKAKAELPQDITHSGITILTSEQSQSEEWDHVFYDPKDKELYKDGRTNLINKKSAYTAVTRARKSIVISLPESQPFSSKKGQVNMIKPISAERITREAELTRIDKILGDDLQAQSKQTVNYTAIQGTPGWQGDSLFTPNEMAAPQNIPASFPSQETAIKGGPEANIDAPTQPASPMMPKATEAGVTMVPAAEADVPSAIADMLDRINKKETVGLFTFFTAERPGMSVYQQMDLKRRILSSPKVRAATSLYLSIAKIGSPNYRNIVRNDPSRAGAYAAFLEAEYEGQNVVLGALPDKDPDDPSFSVDNLVRKNGLMTGRDEIRIPLDSSILSMASNVAPIESPVNVLERPLGSIMSNAIGINFGKVLIATAPIESPNVITKQKAKLKILPGEPFIGASFTLTAAEIETRLNRNVSDREITLIPLRTEKLPFEEIESILYEYLDGEGKFAFSGEAAILYDSLFGSLGNSRVAPGQAKRRKRNRLGEAFRDILRRVNKDTDAHYYEFLQKYAIPDEDLQAREAMQKVSREMGKDADLQSTSNSQYFLKNYMERKASMKPTTLFERAIGDLKTHPNFKLGFDFDPQAAKSSSASPVFAEAKQLPQRFYNDLLKQELGDISPPSIRLPKSDIIQALKKATVETPTTPEVTVSEDGKYLDYNKTEKTEGSPDYQRMESQFSSLETKTLVDFQQTYFPGAAVVLLQKAVDNFKRGLHSSIFRVRGSNPSIAPIQDVPNETEPSLVNLGAVSAFRKTLEQKRDMFPAKWNNYLANPDEQVHYIDTVLANNFDFLIEQYFPTLKKTPQGYIFRATHHKMKSFAEKDSMSLLHEGMNEMLLTQLFNTPVLTRNQNGTWSTMKDSNGNTRYLNRTDIEEISREFTGINTLDEIEEMLSNSVSPVVQSIYYRFFAKEPINVDSVPTWSIGAIQDEQAWKIRDGIASFFLSGEIYNMAYVDNTKEKYALPISVFGRPTVIREQGIESINTTLSQMNISPEREGYYYTDKLGRLDKKEVYSDQEVIDAVRGIGLSWFNQTHLSDIVANEADGLGISGPQTRNRINSYLMDNVVFKSLRDAIGKGYKAGRVPSNFGHLNVVFKAISRVEGIQSSLDYINLNGDLVYRLRNTAPVFNYGLRIKEVKNEPASALAENMIVKGTYSIDSMFIKDGFTDTFKGQEKGKSVSNLSKDELTELDILWGFANTLKESYGRTGYHSQAALPFLVYGDSTTDITPIVRTDNFFRGPEAIARELFSSNAVYYTRLQTDILDQYRNNLGIDAKSLSELNTLLEQAQVPYAVVERIPGMVKNLYYDKGPGGTARIKASLIQSTEFFSRGTNVGRFFTDMSDKAKSLIDTAKKTKSGRSNLYDRLNNVIEGKTPEQILRAFHFNWYAFTTSMRQLTVGPKEQYKGNDDTTSYIDMVKRSKAEASTHSMSLYRRYDWAERVAKEGLTPELIHEGKKMPRYVKVAYVKDIGRALLSFAGETKSQEIFDGATFVTPLTRIFQRQSNGGEFGTQTPPVMKNITTMFNPKNGVKTFIKNAEFEITPELLANGTDALRGVAVQMLSQPFSTGQGSAYEMLQAMGVSPDLSNVTRENFEQLADQLVQVGEQASVIMEVIPATSAKTGQGAINRFVSDTPYVTEMMDLANKGTQLDASHDPYSDMYTTLPSQLINALGIGWTNPRNAITAYSTLAAIANKVSDSWAKLTPDLLKDKIKAIVRTSVETKQNISYAHSLVRTDFPVDDRQIIGMVAPNVNADISRSGISFAVKGGQYVLHPSDEVIDVFDVPGEEGKPAQVVLRSKAPAGAVGRKLMWKAPVRADGVSLDQLIFEMHQKVTGFSTPEEIDIAYATNPELKAKRDAAMMEVRSSLASGDWSPGEAEIILPAEMQREFGLLPGMNVGDVNPDFFAQQFRDKAERLKLEADENMVKEEAELMFLAFQKRLEGNIIRIPTTGKHSSINTKVVAFTEGSLNSVFAPSMLLFIQGADQDIDKGNYLTYETINGRMPMLDDNLQLIAPDLYKNDPDKAWYMAARNKLVQAIRDTMADTKNTYESNVSVDTALQVLKDLRDQKNANSAPFTWDSYETYARMHEIAQVAKSLVGAFANAQKGYQVLYSLYKSQGFTDNKILANLGPVEGTDVWINLAGLINAATDDLKEQILGPLGINETNAGMVSFLVTRGMQLPEIVQFLEDNRADLEKMKEFRRYDVHRTFKPEKEWSNNSRLIRLFRLAEEFTTFSQGIMNREIPSSAYDMFRYGNRIEKFVNESYKRAGMQMFFDFDKFIRDDSYALEHIDLYQSMIRRDTMGNIEGNHAYNILDAFKHSPHVSAYINLYKTSQDIMNSVSRVIPATNKLAKDYSYGEGDETKIVVDRQFRDMMDFVYGIAVHKYFMSTLHEQGNFKLFEPEGRSEFVKWMGSTGLENLKAKYPTNGFINSLNTEMRERYKYEKAPLVRTYDLMNVSEEKMLELRVGLEQVDPQDRQMLVNYSLIVNRGAMGKGSFSQLFHVNDIEGFNSFMKGVESLEVPVNVYNRFVDGDKTLLHNAIPYEDQYRISDRYVPESPDPFQKPWVGYSGDTTNRRKVTQYLNNLATEEDIESFMDELPNSLDKPFADELNGIANRKLRQLRGKTFIASEPTTERIKKGATKPGAVLENLKLAANNANDGRLKAEDYRNIVTDINSMFSFRHLADIRREIWSLPNISRATAWKLTEKIQARFDELNSDKYSQEFREENSKVSTSRMDYEMVEKMIESIEPNEKGYLDSQLFKDLKETLNNFPMDAKEKLLKRLGQIPEINPAVIKSMSNEPFHIAERPAGGVVPSGVIEFVNRVSGAQIRKGIGFEDQLNFSDIRGYKGSIPLGASFMDFVVSVRNSKKPTKADKIMLMDIIKYAAELRNKQVPSKDVEERVKQCK
jgi:hypothetical protein